MRFICHILVLVLLSPLFSGAQTNLQESTPTGEKTNKSHILRSVNTPTAFIKVEVKDAFYDDSKNFLPYYLLQKTTDYYQNAVPVVIPQVVQVVAAPHQAILRKAFGAYLGKSFETQAIASLCKNQNLNHYQLFPFRLNAQNEVEELIDYRVEWQVTSRPTNALAKESSGYKTTSVLASGNWYKIGITKTGMYKLTKSFLSAIGMNVSNLDPKKIRVYGNGGKMVPEKNGEYRLDDLEETATLVQAGNDGAFDNSDYIVFYATGTDAWKKTNAVKNLKFRATKNLYSDTSFYYVTADLGEGKKMNTLASLNTSPNATTNTYDYYNLHEQNSINFGKSGREFYGEYFDVTSAYKFSFTDGDFVVGDSIYVDLSVAAVNRDSTQFLLSGNGIQLNVRTDGLNVGQVHEDFAAPASKFGMGINTAANEIGLTVSKLTAKSLGWMDKLTVNARRKLNITTRQFSFRDSRVTSAGKICGYTLNNNSGENLVLLNTTDPLNPAIQTYSVSGTDLLFVATADSLNEYCVAPGSDLFTPTFVGKVPNQNLHSIEQADFLIVTHPLFLTEARRIGAFHAQQDGLSYAVATTDEVYNEFGSGKPDISAIRDFIRMLYSRNISSGKQVKYVLLFGDGSYKNNNRNLVNNSNLIPTYQSINSLSETQSIATDDFYGLMDPDEGVNAENYGKIDVGIGRFTCRTPTEAKAIVDKIFNYYRSGDIAAEMNSTENCNVLSESPMGDWRNWLLFLADDEDNALHMIQSNNLTGSIKDIAPSYSADKIFLDAYQRTSTPGGYRYPDASEDFVKRIKKGALIFNYTGHGGEVGLTAERMVDLDLINKLDNYNKLPLFITATCEFSRYDDPSRTSAGELCLLNPKGGAISLLTTCRLAYSDPNYNLNLTLLDKLFTPGADGKMLKLGDVVQQTKALFKQSYVYANFHLLGDPALTLAYPKYKVHTTAIRVHQGNGAARPADSSGVQVLAKPTPLPTDPAIHIDTLSALSKVTVSGFVSDLSGKIMTEFNGLIYPTVFNKEQEVSCLINSEQSALYNPADSVLRPFEFPLQKTILYRGKTKVDSGKFSFTFMVPKDISFLPGRGKISYYATNGQTDANGSYNNVVVGGVGKNGVTDSDGPKVSLFLNDKNFVNGGITNEIPILYADLVDSSGINTVGSGIGHDISLVLDENSAKPIVLNDYYEANLNSYQSGRVRYPFDELSEGEHRLSFKVWDIQNNSNVVYADFVVAKTAELALKHVLNYPNPFTTNTRFMFQHNQACNPLKVTVQIYTVSGKLVKTILKNVTCEGYQVEGIEWDGRDDYGDKLGRGVYIYKLGILNAENKKAEKIEKLVILN